MHSIHNRFTYSVPASAPWEHPRWELGYVFSTLEVTSSAKPIMTLYPRVDEILDSYADRATRFAKESKPLHRVLPFKRKATPVGDRPDFCLARYVNTVFSHMSRQTKILRSCFVNDSVLLKNVGPGFSIFDSRSVTEFLAVIFAVSTA